MQGEAPGLAKYEEFLPVRLPALRTGQDVQCDALPYVAFLLRDSRKMLIEEGAGGSYHMCL